MALSLVVIEESELRSLSKSLRISVQEYSNGSSQGRWRDPKNLLDTLIHTASHPKTDLRHRATACDTLCGFLDYGSTSASDLRPLCLQSSTWHNVLRAYLERSDDAVKPMRQLLVTLIRILGRQDELTAKSVVQDAAIHCLTLIIGREDLSCVKPAMLTLESLLNTNKINPEVLLSLWQCVSSQGCIAEYRKQSDILHPEDQLVKELSLSILSWVCYVHIAPPAGKLLLAIFKALRGPPLYAVPAERVLPLWIEPVQQTIADDKGMLDTMERYILPYLLRLESDQLAQNEDFLHKLHLEQLLAGDAGSVTENDIRFSLLTLGCIVTGRNSIVPNAALSLLPDESLTVNVSLGLLNHASSEVRIYALSLLSPGARSPASTLRPDVLPFLLEALPAFHADTDSKIRNEFAVMMKQLCMALEQLIKTRARVSHEASAPMRVVVPRRHSQALIRGKSFPNGLLDFLVSYMTYLFKELQLAASYQRHFTTLRALQHTLSTSVAKTAKVDVFSTHTMRGLIDLVMNAFDDVRASAASLLKVFPTEMLSEAFELPFPSKRERSLILERADRMMQRSGRADFADGVGRLYELIHGVRIEREVDTTTTLQHLLVALETDIETATENLHAAVVSAPIHGRLIALRYIMGRKDISSSFEDVMSWHSFHSRLINCFTRVWQIVEPVLCIDSPEGFEEAELGDDVHGDVDIGIKDTLSYSWRTLKEASSLMQALLNNDEYGVFGEKRLLAYEDYFTMGSLSFTQLAALRHRGAFSTVSQTFSSCCIQCTRSKNPSSIELPSHWYQETLKCIQEKASALTRRSAGLPAMICGVLAAYPSGGFLDKVLRELSDIATTAPNVDQNRPANRLPQVHALNCIKDVFTNSRLAPGTDGHLSETISISITCLGSSVWAIRNCGIMLFKALLTRLTGGSGSNMLGTGAKHRRSPKAVYNKFPQLARLIALQLRTSCNLQAQPGASLDRSHQIQVSFPVMEIIERVGVPPDHKNEVEHLLYILLSNQVWSIREKAARTLSTFSSGFECLSKLKNLATTTSQLHNAIHGHLVCLNYTLQQDTWIREGTLKQTVDLILDLHGFLPTSNPFITTTYLEVVSSMLHILNDCVLKGDARVLENNSSTMAGTHLIRIDQLLGNAITTLEPKLSEFHVAVHDLDAISGPIERFYGLKAQLLSLRSCSGSPTDPGVYKELISIKDNIGLAAVLLSLKKNKMRYKLDGVCGLLESIPRILANNNVDVIALALDHLVSVSCPADYVLTSLCESSEELARLSSLILAILDDSAFTQASLEPAAAPSCLRFRGMALCHLCKHVDGWDMSSYLSSWGAKLILALDGTSDFALRLAAVASIEAFKTVLREATSGTPNGSEQHLPIYLPLYNALIDDDDDIREAAASATSWIVSHPSALKSLNAVTAAQMLLDLLADCYDHSSALCVEGLARIAGLGQQDLRTSLQASQQSESEATRAAVQSRHMIEQALKDDDSLFVEEKQNLYVDQSQQADQWAKVICNMSDQAITPASARFAIMWSKSGLLALIEQALCTIDGPLGWTSKPDVFESGMRVFAMAEVALQWTRKLPTSHQGNEVESRLSRLLSLEGEHQLNGHWMMKIEEILSTKG